MNFIRKSVRHKFFGKGEIIQQDADILVVNFGIKTAKFLYPDSFESFLTFEDDYLQKNAELELQHKKQEFERQKLAEEELRKRQQEEQEKIINMSIAEQKLTSMFKEDYRVEHLARQPVFTYTQVEEKFGIKITGFGKGINSTRTSIVLISSIGKSNGAFVYHDHWAENGDYIYSGEGKTGNQLMQKGNLAIADSAHNGKPIHLFVKFSPQEYYYQGIFHLVDYTYEIERDENGHMRLEYKFRLRKNK